MSVRPDSVDEALQRIHHDLGIMLRKHGGPLPLKIWKDVVKLQMYMTKLEEEHEHLT